ncbi:hypothetical protein [Escherichia coli]|nr:hypothetical protein [Escherichia coli]
MYSLLLCNISAGRCD